MKNRIRNLISVGVYSLLLVGCATGPKGASNDVGSVDAAKASRVYLDQVRLVTVENMGKTPHFQEKQPCWSAEEVEIAAKKTKVWRELAMRANGCLADKNWKSLRAVADVLAKSDLQSPWGAYYLSLAAEGSGDLPRAHWMADLAAKKAGGTFGLFELQKGRLMLQSNNPAQAMKHVERAIELDPGLVEGHLFLADMHRRDQEPELAERLYLDALKADAINERALLAMAELKEQNAPAEAADYYSRLVALHPARLSAWLRLAYIHEVVQKNPSQAVSTYRSLKVSIDRGVVHEHPPFDLTEKIRNLESSLVSSAAVQAKADINSKAKKGAVKK